MAERIIRIKNYIGGQWLDSESKQTFKSMNPAVNTETVAVAPQSTQKDVDYAVKTARKAFDAWRLTPAPKRGEILYKASQLILERKKQLGELVTIEMGKVINEGLGDVQEAIDIGYYFAGEGRRSFGQTMPCELKEKSVRTIREPVGVFGLITPWNFPIAIPAWKIFPALIYGNTVVFKPSKYTPACAFKLVECFADAGLPKGVLNLVNGFGEEAGNHLVTHDGIDGISFTGSSIVGKRIGATCAKKLKKHSLEMGGKNCVIVMDDAKLDLAVEGALWGGFGTTGQRCTAVSRVIVHKKVFDNFKKKFVAAAKKLKLGNGLKPTTEVGPLVNLDAVQKTHEYVRIGRNEDKAKMLCGGDYYKNGECKKGHFYQPTIFTNVKPNMRIAQEEIFGPVVALLQAENLKDAIKIANSTKYGLSMSIYTENVRAAETAARDLQSGLIYINSPTIGAEIQTPFGGLKNTGNGHREAGGIGGAIETYTEMKVVYNDFSGKLQKAQID
ncbi:MAG: aldehyde dehydrogenase family protein [Nanoarchaeota archaeon]|nr:aldehyde dehydrogenase family protein [Nanoarchaeota archaeon]